MDTDRWMDMIVRHLIKMQPQMEWEVYVEAWEELLRLQSQRINSHDYGLVHRYAWPTGKERPWIIRHH